jgi:hypothetical protein
MKAAKERLEAANLEKKKRDNDMLAVVSLSGLLGFVRVSIPLTFAPSFAFAFRANNYRSG